MGDSYGTLHQLADLTDDLPVVYAGIDPHDMPKAMGHPNTFRMFAQPLAETFGRTVYGISHLSATGADPRPTLTQVVQGMREEQLQRVAYVEVISPNRLDSLVAPGDPALDIRTTGRVKITIPMLARPRWHTPKGWRIARFELEVHVLTLR